LIDFAGLDFERSSKKMKGEDEKAVLR
jgi:hypothetical protein